MNVELFKEDVQKIIAEKFNVPLEKVYHMDGAVWHISTMDVEEFLDGGKNE